MPLRQKQGSFNPSSCALFTSFVTFLFKISLFSLGCIIDSRMQLRRTKVGLVPLRFGQFGFFYSTSRLHDLTTVIALHWGACWELLSSSVLHQMIYNTHCNENKVLGVSSNISSFLCSRLVELSQGRTTKHISKWFSALALHRSNFTLIFTHSPWIQAAYFKDDSWYRKLLAVLMVGSNS